MSTRFSVAAVLLASIVWITPVEAAIPLGQRASLMQLYISTSGLGWKNHTNWGGAPGTECTWYGVACDATSSNVIFINLRGNHLVGTIPSEIGGLTALQGLYLDSNKLSGSIPTTVGSLSNLVELTLSNAPTAVDLNQLTGPIPASIGSLSKLQTLVLSGNALNGPIPQEIGNLKALVTLNLSGNQFTGGIPSSFAQLTNLQILEVSNAGLSIGPIPAQIALLTNLQTLGLANAGLTGTIPTELTQLTKLTALYLAKNSLTGSIPAGISNLSNLTVLRVPGNNMSGGIPQELTQLTRLVDLELQANTFSGALPAGLSKLVNLQTLYLQSNHLSGPIPAEIGQMPKLAYLNLARNQFTGLIPPELGNLPAVVTLVLAGNPLGGSLPAQLGNAKTLEILNVENDQLTGPIPAEIAQLTKLTVLLLGYNLFTGGIPSQIFQMSNLTALSLAGSGAIPPEIGNLTNLKVLRLGASAFRGAVPDQITNLTNLTDGLSDFAHNALYTNNSATGAFLSKKQFNLPWDETQTVAPSGLVVKRVSSYSVTLSWTPISQKSGPGGYQILGSATPGGPYAALVITRGKLAQAAIVTGLQPSKTYYFVVKTVTYPHMSLFGIQLNTLYSDSTPEVSATTKPPSTTGPAVFVTASPRGILEAENTAGGSDSYTLTNLGGAAASITLTQNGDFFTQTPASFALNPGASQVVTLIGLARPLGTYEGTSIVAGTGAAGSLSIKVKLAVPAASSASAKIVPSSNRIDVSGPEGQNPTGSVTFTNVGSGTFTGVLISDVQWIVPQTGLVTIAPGTSQTLSFSIDRSLRPDASALSGAMTGSLRLITIVGNKTAREWPLDSGSSSGGLATVVDTVKPPTSVSGIPPLGAGEVALFAPGVGHVLGSVGTFLSDLSINNALGGSAISDVKLYFTGTFGKTPTTVASLIPVGVNQTLALADVANSVFGTTADLGTLQVRSADISNLAINANIFNISNPLGFYGTTIPIFRSDRALSAGSDAIYLTGLRQAVGKNHTSIFLQETSGVDANVTVQFYDSTGTAIGSQAASVPAFGLLTILGTSVPAGAVLATIANSSAGSVVAYATPVDELSGDNWAVSDSARQYAFSPNEQVIIPVAGAVHGANSTYFRTDLALTNSGCSRETGTIQYWDSTGNETDESVSLDPLQTLAIDDVITTLFQRSTDSVGYIVLTPDQPADDQSSLPPQCQGARFVATSRTYTTVAGSSATYGTAVPALSTSWALRQGQSRRIASLDDSTLATIQAKTPGTFRTNFGLVETAGQTVVVHVNAYYAVSTGLAETTSVASGDYPVGPHGFVTVSNLLHALLGDARESNYGDLHNVDVEFSVTSGNGAVIPYVSTADNGTGDSVLRLE
jgi:Leucine-rich repeat (LRR) protein